MAQSASDYDRAVTKLMLQDFDHDFISQRGLRFHCPWCDADKGRPDEVQRHMKLKCRYRGGYAAVCSAPNGPLDYSHVRVSIHGIRFSAREYVNRLKQAWIDRQG